MVATDTYENLLASVSNNESGSQNYTVPFIMDSQQVTSTLRGRKQISCELQFTMHPSEIDLSKHTRRVLATFMSNYNTHKSVSTVSKREHRLTNVGVSQIGHSFVCSIGYRQFVF